MASELALLNHDLLDQIGVPAALRVHLYNVSRLLR
jgi:hypothetical protein